MENPRHARTGPTLEDRADNFLQTRFDYLISVQGLTEKSDELAAKELIVSAGKVAVSGLRSKLSEWRFKNAYEKSLQNQPANSAAEPAESWASATDSPEGSLDLAAKILGDAEARNDGTDYNFPRVLREG